MENNPLVSIPSPDRVLSRAKSLTTPSQLFSTKRGSKDHHVSISNKLNRLNLKMLSSPPDFQKENIVSDLITL